MNSIANAPEAAAQAAPAPTAAPGEYDELCGMLEGRVSDYCTGYAKGFTAKDVVLHERAAAAIRKLMEENALLRDRRKRLDAINASPLYGSGEKP
jgi:hypothetical protein